MEHSHMEFHTATACGGGNCLEVGFHQACVLVRNSRHRDRTVEMPLSRWQQIVAEAQVTGQVDLTIWFPTEGYGDFASTFTEKERHAFESGVLAGELQLIAPAKAV